MWGLHRLSRQVLLRGVFIAAALVLSACGSASGIDVAAKFEIYTIIKRLAAEGSGILLISSEIEEAMEMCDRIIVMRQGEISGVFDRAQFSKESVLRAAFGEESAA